MTGRLQHLKAIEVNETLKIQFLNSLKRAKPALGIHSMHQIWLCALKEIMVEIQKIPDGYSIDWDSVEQMLLLSAEYGLSFAPRAKELYIDVRSGEDYQNNIVFALGLKYNGMKHRLVKVCGVRMLTTEVVYEKDTFEWRGQWKEPLYVMANDSSELHCCFGMVKLNSGEIMAYKLTKEELLELERNDVVRATEIYNNPNASLYKSAYRKRMFEIATLRYLYSQLISMFEHTPDTETNKEFEEQQVLAEALELELNNARAAG